MFWDELPSPLDAFFLEGLGGSLTAALVCEVIAAGLGGLKALVAGLFLCLGVEATGGGIGGTS